MSVIRLFRTVTQLVFRGKFQGFIEIFMFVPEKNKFSSIGFRHKQILIVKVLRAILKCESLI